MKQTFKHLYLIMISMMCLIVDGCTSFRGPKYPDIIYNNEQPLISVSYEYGEIQIILPIKYEAALPNNILFKVFAHADTMNPIISILQEPPNEFRTSVPQGVLDTKEKTNLIRIIPQGKDFDQVDVRFKGIHFGRIVLPPKMVRIGQLIVSGKTFLINNDSTLANVEITLQNFDNIIHSTYSNENGLFQIAIPGEYKFAEHLRIVAGDNMVFKPFIRQLDFTDSRKVKLDVGLGPSKEMKGPLYIVNKDNVQFKKNPDIGSEILFLLQQGEVLSVERITPGAYFGYIEVKLKNDKYVKMEGWVNRLDIEEINMSSINKGFSDK